jgi:protein O-GlcNAc transferase
MKAQRLFENAVKDQLEGRLQDAKTAYQKLLRLYPTNSEVLGNLGTIIRREGKFEAAEQLLQRALRANPKNTSALATLSNLKINQKRYDEAIEFAEKSISINPSTPEPYVNIGVVLVNRGQLKLAERNFIKALKHDPDNINAKMNLANCHRAQKIYVDESLKALLDLEKQDPNNADIQYCIGTAYIEKTLYIKALEKFERAYQLYPKPEVLTMTANLLVVLGELEEAMAKYREVLVATPDNVEVSTTILFTLNYDDTMSAAQVFDEYKKYGESISRGKKQYDHRNHPTTRGRRIRVGYSSADFYGHVVMYFIGPIFKYHNHLEFETFGYSNVQNPDRTTEQISKMFDHWIEVSEMTHEEMAQRIYDDQIDVMIDLSGHTAGTRVDAFAMRPAPVQATYLGFGYTTGMSEVDYFIGDENFTPPGCEPYFAEKVFRIPAPVYAYSPPTWATPDVAPDLPAYRRGHVTFGTMSRIIRLNNGLLRVWKKILDRVPGSKLRVDQKPYADPETLERTLLRFEKLGFSRDQVELVSSTPHWNGYHEFDIALDCWPHNAGTTTMEALWMGVPVLSKRDRPSVGRLSDLVLQPLGLGDWVVDTEEEYVEKAVTYANDLPMLAEMRITLRDRMRQSPFMDFEARTRALEGAYRKMILDFEEKTP